MQTSNTPGPVTSHGYYGSRPHGIKVGKEELKWLSLNKFFEFVLFI